MNSGISFRARHNRNILCIATESSSYPNPVSKSRDAVLYFEHKGGCMIQSYPLSMDTKLHDKEQGYVGGSEMRWYDQHKSFTSQFPPRAY